MLQHAEKKPHPLNNQTMGLLLIYASSEKNRMLACRFGEHRDNSRNSQSVFLVVYLLLILYSSLGNRISALGTELISSYKRSTTFTAYRLYWLLWLYWLLRLYWLALELSLLLHWLALELSLLLWLHWLALELSLLLWLHWLSLELSLLWWYISIHILLWHSLISVHHFLSD